jgi:hypothetical protein
MQSPFGVLDPEDAGTQSFETSGILHVASQRTGIFRSIVICRRQM